jgi:hypothetical protein
MMTKQSAAVPALPTMKMKPDSPQSTKSREELELLKRVIAESKVFRKPTSENVQQPGKWSAKALPAWQMEMSSGGVGLYDQP